MKRIIKDIAEALEIYLNAARENAEASEQYDSRKTNKTHDIIRKCEKYLYDNNSMILLEKYLNDPIPGVRVWIALDLLPIIPEKAIEVLEEIANGSYGVAKIDASDILNEWKKGTLVFPYMK